MILFVTHSTDATADYFASYLCSTSEPFFRFDTDLFLSSYSLDFSDVENARSFTLINRCTQQRASSLSIRGIWYRRPVRPKINLDETNVEIIQALSSEARMQYESTLRSLDHPVWVSFPERLRFAEDRLVQLDFAKKCGFSTPHTVITNVEETARLFVSSHKKTCLKPIILGQIPIKAGLGLFYTALVDQSDEDFFSKVHNFPVLLQEYINKKRELRITVVGKDVFPVRIVSQDDPEAIIDWRIDNGSRVKFEPTTLTQDVCHQVLHLMNLFGLNFASMDVVVSNEDKYYFLDLNPNGQWAWLDQSLGLGIAESLRGLLSGRK